MQVAQLVAAAHGGRRVFAAVAFRGLVEYGKDALGSGDAALDGGVDVGELAQGLGDQAGGGNVGQERSRIHVPAQGRIESEPEQQRQGGVGQPLDDRRGDLVDAGQFQVLAQGVLAALAKALVLRRRATKTSHHGKAADRLGGHARNAAHGILDTAAVLLELARGEPDDGADQRCHNDEQQGQFPVEVEDVGEERHHRQPLAHDDLDGTGGRRGHLLDIEGDQRQQLRRVAFGEVGAGEPVDVRKDVDAQAVDDLPCDVGDVVATQVRTDTAQRDDRDQGQGQEMADP
jgi:hypothetical protein